MDKRKTAKRRRLSSRNIKKEYFAFHYVSIVMVNHFRLSIENSKRCYNNNFNNNNNNNNNIENIQVCV